MLISVKTHMARLIAAWNGGIYMAGWRKLETDISTKGSWINLQCRAKQCYSSEINLHIAGVTTKVSQTQQEKITCLHLLENSINFNFLLESNIVNIKY